MDTCPKEKLVDPRVEGERGQRTGAFRFRTQNKAFVSTAAHVSSENRKHLVIARRRQKDEEKRERMKQLAEDSTKNSLDGFEMGLWRSRWGGGRCSGTLQRQNGVPVE